MEYVNDWKDRYNNAYLACRKYLESECCKQCLIEKLISLELDQYVEDLHDPDNDDDDDDSGVEEM